MTKGFGLLIFQFSIALNVAPKMGDGHSRRR